MMHTMAEETVRAGHRVESGRPISGHLRFQLFFRLVN